MKRRHRRRSIWERGIIRKKKCGKKEEAEDDEAEEEEGAEDLAGASQGNAGLNQDESSCDTMEHQTDKPLSQPNGYALSTEEENSSEATPTQDPNGQDPATTTTYKNGSAEEEKGAIELSDHQECVNGDESMDSIASEANDKVSVGNGKEITAPFEEAAQAESGDVVLEGTTKERMTAEGAFSDGDHEAEGISKENKFGGIQSEQHKGVVAERPEEPPQPPPPPALVVDHCRLRALLDQTVEKSEGYSVDQLERLYSVLSQCIYQHRRDYDKTNLIKELERHVRDFNTFL